MQNNIIHSFGSLVLGILAILGVATILVVSVGYSIEKSAEVECETWAKYAKAYPLFYLTPTQRAQCDHHGVDIDAEVR